MGDISVGFIVPWREQKSRLNQFNKMLMHYDDFLKDKEVFYADYPSEIFSRSHSINLGMKYFFDKNFDIVIVNDADTLCNIDSINKSIIKSYELQRALLPYDSYIMRSSGGGIEHTLHPSSSIDQLWPCSGTNIIPRQVYMDIGGFDENLVGWGPEDQEYHYRYFLHYGEKYLFESGTCEALWHKRGKISEQTIKNLIYACEKHPESVSLKMAYLDILNYIDSNIMK